MYSFTEDWTGIIRLRETDPGETSFLTARIFAGLDPVYEALRLSVS
jgi:hypothetical protein